ncbi:hypothetical protein [Cellulosimicrobium sp. SH8]|uniref:hypothetical protein n=1 Tax=Cellulosimicrobium sp. SH8 TaxID=2952936 RepID=UPI0021F3AAA4|nr:hypothetical protein [Cellulosimicrobium sp. SH8]
MTSASLLGGLSAYLHHGVLVVEDPASEASHQEWDPERQAYDIEDGSVLVRVRPAVDGPVEVEVHDVHDADGDPTSGLVRLVGTSIDTPDDRVRVHDPEDRVSLVVQSEREGSPTPLPVGVFVDDVEHTARVVILLG